MSKFDSIKPEILELILNFQKGNRTNLYKTTETKIQFDNVMSGFSFFYEKLRNAVDYKEEHLIRKNAIQRILKRKFNLSLVHKNIGQSLVYELIQARYLENGFVPERKIEELEVIVQKYLNLFRLISKRSLTARVEYSDWLLGLAACEVEEKLDFLLKTDSMVTNMYNMVKDKIIFIDQDVSPLDRNLQIYIAIHRSLIKADEDLISYHLLNIYYPHWRTGDEALITEIAKNISAIRQQIKNLLKNKLNLKLTRFLQKHAVYFSILKDFIELNDTDAHLRILNEAKVDAIIKQLCEEKYKALAKKVRRSLVNSVIYIFLTKILIALSLEIPYEWFFYRYIAPFPLIVNISFPPLLMLFLASSVHIPEEENTLEIIKGIKSLIYTKYPETFDYKVKIKVKRSYLKTMAFVFIYLAISATLFFGIVYGLHQIHFSPVSIVLFILFLCVVSYFGIIIRQSIKSIIVLEKRQGFISSFIDFLFFPILKVGRWISINFSKVNIFILVMDFIIEAPFKTLIKMIEDWFSFVREKKDEIV